MRRLAVFLGLCLLCGPGALTAARAQQISIAGDMLLDISLRDADLGEVLTALFNTTGGKYQMLIGSGVTGRIARLQLAQTPFEKALDAILGTEFSYTKQQLREGTFLYRITGRQGGRAMPLTTRGGGVNQATSIGMPPLGNSTSTGTGFGAAAGTGFGAASGTGFGAAAGTSTGTATGGTGLGSSSNTFFNTFNIGSSNTTTADTSTSGASASTESFVIKLLRVNNADVGMISEYLGGTYIDLTELMMPSNEGNGSASRGGSNRSSGASRNTSTRNNNTNTRNNTNNRNYNTNRNTNTRNTNTRNTSTRNTNRTTRTTRNTD